MDSAPRKAEYSVHRKDTTKYSGLPVRIVMILKNTSSVDHGKKGYLIEQ